MSNNTHLIASLIAANTKPTPPALPCAACGGAHRITQCNTIAHFDMEAHLREELEKAQDERDSAQASLARARKEIESYHAVIDDATKRYSYLYDGWRKAQSNDEVADVVRKAMFNWEETRAALYERKDTMTTAPDPPPDPGPLDDDCPPTCPDQCPDHSHGMSL
jgi:hypothetical protein